jgi:hypothetical protein
LDNEDSNFLRGALFGATFGLTQRVLKQYFLFLLFDKSHKDLLEYVAKNNSTEMLSQLKGS